MQSLQRRGERRSRGAWLVSVCSKMLSVIKRGRVSLKDRLHIVTRYRIYVCMLDTWWLHSVGSMGILYTALLN